MKNIKTHKMEMKKYKTCNYVLNVMTKEYDCSTETEYKALDKNDFFVRLTNAYLDVLNDCIKSGNYTALFFYYDCDFNSNFTLIESDDLNVNGKNLNTVFKKEMETIKNIFILIGDVYVYSTKKDLFETCKKTRHSLKSEICDMESFFITRVVDEYVKIPGKYDRFCKMNSDFEVIELFDDNNN